jgi:thiol-disulfide isomerase/thioredoxin
MTATTHKAEVELLTATWCKRCKEIKPVVQQISAMIGASYREVDYEELEDDDPVKVAVKALPTIRVRLLTVEGSPWRVFVPAELEAWNEFMLNSVAFSSAVNSADLDF